VQFSRAENIPREAQEENISKYAVFTPHCSYMRRTLDVYSGTMLDEILQQSIKFADNCWFGF
jgi:hypothetical protein